MAEITQCFDLLFLLAKEKGSFMNIKLENPFRATESFCKVEAAKSREKIPTMLHHFLHAMLRWTIFKKCHLIEFVLKLTILQWR